MRAAGEAQALAKEEPNTGDAGAGEDHRPIAVPHQGAAMPWSQRTGMRHGMSVSQVAAKSGRTVDVEVALEEQAGSPWSS